MKWFGSLSLFIVIFTCFSACRQEQNKADTARLVRLDSLLTTQPEAVFDSLKRINADKLNNYNEGYFHLLDIIAKDKSYFNFTSDSLITEAVGKLSKYSDKQPRTYARSLMYQGIVRYRMQITDSTTYQPLKEAAAIFRLLNSYDMRNEYLCLYYIGEILDKNNNEDLAKVYLIKAAQVARQIGDTSYLFTSYRNLFWYAMTARDLQTANHYIDSLSHYLMPGDDYKISYLNMQSTYFLHTNQSLKSIELEQQILRIKQRSEYENNLITNYFNLSKSYRNIHQPDSAYKYANLAIASINDTTYRLNYLYYNHLARVAEELKKWETSSMAYKKAYKMLDNTIDKNMDTKILELEKKYSLTEAENKTLHFKNRSILLAAIVLLLFLTIVILTQHYFRQKKIKLLTEQRNEALENEQKLLNERQLRLDAENKRNKQELAEKHIILSLFKQVSNQNLEIKNLLFDLKVNRQITEMPALYNRISQEYDSYTKGTNLSEAGIFTDRMLKDFTCISDNDITHLNNSEKVFLMLIALHAGNHEIALLLNISDDSVRSRKLKLKKKLESRGISVTVF